MRFSLNRTLFGDEESPTGRSPLKSRYSAPEAIPSVRSQAPISLDIPTSLPYLVAIITEKANLVKTRDAKARVFVRPTKGRVMVRDGMADPHKIAALPKMKIWWCGF